MMVLMPLFMLPMVAVLALPVVGIVLAVRWITRRADQPQSLMSGHPAGDRPLTASIAPAALTTLVPPLADGAAAPQRELVAARREMDALREQLAWQSRLLERPAATVTAAGASTLADHPAPGRVARTTRLARNDPARRAIRQISAPPL